MVNVQGVGEKGGTHLQTLTLFAFLAHSTAAW
jgi:hypothetical protein